MKSICLSNWTIPASSTYTKFMRRRTASYLCCSTWQGESCMNRSVSVKDSLRVRLGRNMFIQVLSVLIRNLMRILIDAIRYCHELEIIHRDIKVIYAIDSLKTYYWRRMGQTLCWNYLISGLARYWVMESWIRSVAPRSIWLLRYGGSSLMTVELIFGVWVSLPIICS